MLLHVSETLLQSLAGRRVIWRHAFPLGIKLFRLFNAFRVKQKQKFFLLRQTALGIDPWFTWKLSSKMLSSIRSVALVLFLCGCDNPFWALWKRPFFQNAEETDDNGDNSYKSCGEITFLIHFFRALAPPTKWLEVGCSYRSCFKCEGTSNWQIQSIPSQKWLQPGKCNVLPSVVPHVCSLLYTHALFCLLGQTVGQLRGRRGWAMEQRRHVDSVHALLRYTGCFTADTHQIINRWQCTCCRARHFSSVANSSTFN